MKNKVRNPRKKEDLKTINPFIVIYRHRFPVH